MAHDTEAGNRGRSAAHDPKQDVKGLDYNAPAELYSVRSQKGAGKMRYRRFNTAAEALKCAVEQMSAQTLHGAYLEVDEARFGPKEMRQLYESPAYPLARTEL